MFPLFLFVFLFLCSTCFGTSSQLKAFDVFEGSAMTVLASTTTPPVPSVSGCSSCYVTNGILACNSCLIGSSSSTKPSSLPLSSCPSFANAYFGTDLSGNIGCIPRGTYSETCSGQWYQDPTVHTTCQRKDRSWVSTALNYSNAQHYTSQLATPVDACTDVNNNDGTLQCLQGNNIPTPTVGGCNGLCSMANWFLSCSCLITPPNAPSTYVTVNLDVLSCSPYFSSIQYQANIVNPSMAGSLQCIYAKPPPQVYNPEAVYLYSDAGCTIPWSNLNSADIQYFSQQMCYTPASASFSYNVQCNSMFGSTVTAYPSTSCSTGQTAYASMYAPQGMCVPLAPPQGQSQQHIVYMQVDCGGGVTAIVTSGANNANGFGQVSLAVRLIATIVLAFVARMMW